MIKTIWKFELQGKAKQNISMPKDAELLTVQAQNERPCLWALVQPDNPEEQRTFEMIGTGIPILEESNIERKYISSYQLHDGAFVFHAFELITK